MKWLGHVVRMTQDRLPRKVFDSRAMGNNMKGRPRRGWEDNIKTTIEFERGQKNVWKQSRIQKMEDQTLKGRRER